MTPQLMIVKAKDDTDQADEDNHEPAVVEDAADADPSETSESASDTPAETTPPTSKPSKRSRAQPAGEAAAPADEFSSSDTAPAKALSEDENQKRRKTKASAPRK